MENMTIKRREEICLLLSIIVASPGQCEWQEVCEVDSGLVCDRFHLFLAQPDSFTNLRLAVHH